MAPTSQFDDCVAAQLITPLPCLAASMHHRGMDDEVPAAVLAEFIGVSPRSLTELGRRGVAVRAGPGRWRLQESVRRYCDGLRHRGGGEAVRTTTTVERGRLAKEQADSFALKNARLRGALVETEAVQREWTRYPDFGSEPGSGGAVAAGETEP